MESETQSRGGRLKQAAKILLRLLIAAMVAWGVYRAAGKAHDEMQSRRARLQAEAEALQQRIEDGSSAPELAEQLELKRRQLANSPWSARPGWLLAAGALYLSGLLPNAVFWRQIMWAMGARPTWRKTMTAYFVGHLGKYVPGKALVVVLRTSLVKDERTPASVAALAVFVETLTMMAVGGAVASLVLVFAIPDRLMLVLAVALMIAAGVPTLPPIFRVIVRLLKVRVANPQIDQALQGLDFSLMARGWPLIALGWLLLGLSLWATLMASPFVELSTGESCAHLPMLTACVALAMVLGFVSLLPGGAGVREWVVMTLVAPLAGVGAFPAFAAAVWLRIIWLLSEIAISTILYLLPTRERDSEQEVG